jgi:hypothetical protein
MTRPESGGNGRGRQDRRNALEITAPQTVVVESVPSRDTSLGADFERELHMQRIRSGTRSGRLGSVLVVVQLAHRRRSTATIAFMAERSPGAELAAALLRRPSARPRRAVLVTIAIVRAGHVAYCRLMLKAQAVDEWPQPPNCAVTTGGSQRSTNYLPHE